MESEAARHPEPVVLIVVVGHGWYCNKQTKRKQNNSYEYGSKSVPKVVFFMFWYQVQVVQKYPKTKNWHWKQFGSSKLQSMNVSLRRYLAIHCGLDCYFREDSQDFRGCCRRHRSRSLVCREWPCHCPPLPWTTRAVHPFPSVRWCTTFRGT